MFSGKDVELLISNIISEDRHYQLDFHCKLEW
jgi:hypothetical protein